MGLTLVDLFCGVGGFSYAFKKAKVVFANDVEPTCKQTYDLNHSIEMTLGDIHDIADSVPPADILCAGFPCQPFSIAGKQLGFEDERANVFFTLIRILKRTKPRCVLLENVKNLLSHDNGKTFETISQQLKQTGYHIKYKVLNTATHGDRPQNRERIYIVCFRDEELCRKFKFPNSKNLTTTVQEHLEETVADKYYYNDRIKLWKELEETVIDRNSVYQYRRVYIRKNQKGLCPTLTANMGTGGHNVPIILDSQGIRKLTPRECFSLQGYPKHFELPKLADCKLYKQAGNSVTVTLVKRLAKRIIKLLDAH